MVTVIKKSVKKKDNKNKINSLNKVDPAKIFKASEFCGKVKYKEDALAMQKKVRNEWK